MRRTKLKMMFALLLYACLLMSCVSTSEVVASKAVFMFTYNQKFPDKYSNKIARYIKRHSYLKDKEKMPDRYYFRIKSINTPVFCVKNPEDNYFYLGVDSCKYILPIGIYTPRLRFKVFSDYEELMSYNEQREGEGVKIDGKIGVLIDSTKNIIYIRYPVMRSSCWFKSDGSLDDCYDGENGHYYIKANGELEMEQF